MQFRACIYRQYPLPPTPRTTTESQQRRASQWSKQRQAAGGANIPLRNLPEDWVCWECEEDMALALEYYRSLKVAKQHTLHC